MYIRNYVEHVQFMEYRGYAQLARPNRCRKISNSLVTIVTFKPGFFVKKYPTVNGPSSSLVKPAY